MKKTSRIFLIIGKVMAIIELISSIVICTVFIALGFAMALNPDSFNPNNFNFADSENVDAIMIVGIVYLAVGFTLLILLPIASALSISFSKKALHALKSAKNVSDVKGKAIACIIIGAIASNEFLLAGGILLTCLREKHFAQY